MGAAFAFTESAVANQRATNDALNGIAGGCAAGFLAGLRSVLSYWVYCLFILYVNPSTFNTGCTWIVRCNWRGYGHLRLRRGNCWQVQRGEGGEEKEVFQISISACPSRFRVEAESPHFDLELNAGTGLASLENFKYIQQIFEDTTFRQKPQSHLWISHLVGGMYKLLNMCINFTLVCHVILRPRLCTFARPLNAWRSGREEI